MFVQLEKKAHYQELILIPSCSEKIKRWIQNNPYLFAINIIFLAAIVACCSIDLSFRIKLIISCSLGTSIPLINGIHYFRKKTEPKAISVLGPGFTFFLLEAGLKKETTLPIVSVESVQKMIGADVQPEEPVVVLQITQNNGGRKKEHIYFPYNKTCVYYENVAQKSQFSMVSSRESKTYSNTDEASSAVVGLIYAGQCMTGQITR